MKIGCIYCGYQCADLLEASLTPWIAARAAQLGGHTYIIAAVSVPFDGFPQDEAIDLTLSTLGDALDRGDIDEVIGWSKPTKETEARGAALRWLMTQGIDICVQVDSDEVFAQTDIERIFAFVQQTPDIVWYRLSLRNAVFSPTTFLAEPFTPPRVHRVRAGGYQVHHFSGDNDIAYGGTITRDILPQDRFASMTVPTSVAFVRHMSWLNDERSRRKCCYQAARWNPPVGAGCAFRWDETRGLVWNEEHFRLTGQPIPEVVHEG